MLCSVLPTATHRVSTLWVQQIPVLRSLSKPFLLKALSHLTTYSFLAADVSTGVCTKFVLTVLRTVVDGCGCQVFVSTGSWQLPQPRILDVGWQARFTCCSARERQEMLFMVSSLSFFVSISWKWQVKRLKWIVFVDDLSRKAIVYMIVWTLILETTLGQGFFGLAFCGPSCNGGGAPDLGFTRITVYISSKSWSGIYVWYHLIIFAEFRDKRPCLVSSLWISWHNSDS